VTAMKSDMIHDKARVWTVTLGPDGKLRAELDPRRVAALFARPERLAA
jgi:hypothetical protein